METINTIIALLALVISVVALAISRRQYLHDTEIKYREELSGILAVFAKFRTTYSLMKRERDKTGAEITEYEEEIFSQAEKLCNLQDEVEGLIKKALEQDVIKYDRALFSQAKVFRDQTEGLSHWVEHMFDRFKRFNENKLPELKKKIDEIQKKLDSLQP
ncbi:MAG: hypothetical protein OEV31_03775 [Gammaproteobacteria bacterium]|nr:hypothetical protein [Gammaproteobacteria bacterium]